MRDIAMGFLEWAWSLITGIQGLVAWLFTPLEGLSALVGINIMPIYLVGVGALTIGIVRAIL